MTTLNHSSQKKSLVITGVNEDTRLLVQKITNKKLEDLVILSSFGSVISQPFGCLMRNIILATYKEDIDGIYIFGENTSVEEAMSKEKLVENIQATGVAEEVLKTLNYIDVVNHDLLNWLAGPTDIKETIKTNIELVKNHPLILKTIPIYGYLVDVETGEFDVVS
ncbi:hypothetical protein FS935_22490 [Metabacillus litoralis]|uniref:Carbonic anhydrase n=1 Tax=Metabacillus litoralis TaxID=152268 RepID=A0A5C6UZ72_9BACI|nr:hypothetical protein [Metabacillus litoralis]TXC78722.1 hypothetical protein FS935_22490 [Metabacillus litoralis]